MFTDKDLEQIQQRGSQPETVEQQLKYFKQGFPFLPIVKEATPDDGILVPDKEGCKRYENHYNSRFAALDVVKFVPASGAASRMFKSLFSTLEEYNGSEAAYAKIVSDQSFQSVWNFFKSIENFAFFQALKDVHQELHGISLEESLLRRDYAKVLSSLLGEEGLNYGNLPKGLLQFHRYDEGSRTALEEHMVEGANYCRDKNGVVRLHFTVSPEHREKFMARIAQVKDAFEQKFNVSYHLSFSEQKASTDTIAVNPDNSPFREDNGELLFRPAGHGALIENLNDIDADIIFIKNIDNVVPDHLKDETYRYKRVIAGVLLDYQEKIHAYLNQIDHGDVSADLLDDIQSFLQNKLCIKDIPEIADEQKRIDFLYRKLNRPVRVCGMVKNEGEPGGGPFFARNADGTISLQIAESSQIDINDPQAKNIAASATHFNPVDLVCSVKDHLGNKYALDKFVDPQTGFISVKSKSGKDLKALELPGLWNGAMSDWNTIFVEVPIITFNPVKTVNDLLRDQHQ
jgi:hypothetical protein